LLHQERVEVLLQELHLERLALVAPQQVAVVQEQPLVAQVLGLEVELPS
jgi:hypothetical protein